MKRIAILVCIILLAGCGAPTQTETRDPSATAPAPATYTAAQVMEAFKAAGLPVVNVVEYDATTDPNARLGRPGQYISKVNFDDTTQAGYNPDLSPEASSLSTIECFANEQDRDDREKYILNATKIMNDTGIPGGGYYMYKNKNILVRLDFSLTPDEAAKYEAVLKSL